MALLPTLPPTPPRTAPLTGPLESPLRQVNAHGTIHHLTKFASSWTLLTTNPTLFTGQSASASSRFFLDLFCLRVNSTDLLAALDSLDISDLLGQYKNNITHLFTNAVRILKECDQGDTRRDNVFDTLIPMLRNILARRFSNFSFEVMTMLAGSLERSDAVFTDLVSSIDLILQDISYSTELRHRTLQLALVLVTSVNQGSINAFFLRRDLFSTLVKFMTDPATSPFAFESALLLGLLANFRKYEARNPYLVRIEDFVDEVVMRRIIGVATSICTQTRQEYTTVTDDGPPSFVASLTSLVFSLRLSELLSGGFSLSLPPAPTPSSSAQKDPGGGDGYTDGLLAAGGNGTNGVTAKGRSDGTSPPRTPTRRLDEKKEESVFKLMPAEVIVILLPFYDLLNSNKAFCGLVFSAKGDKPPPLPPALISISSYVLCHASVSSRAQAYSRICLILLTILVEEGEGKLTVDGVPIRLCRQRQPMLPYNSNRRPPITAMLDTTVIYLRHNLQKQLDVETYLVCLKLVQRIMQQLKTERVRLEYDWVTVWRSILTLSGFLVSKINDLRVVSPRVDDLISQIFVVLSYAVYWGESFFETSTTSVLLHYELLHSDVVLQALAAFITPATPPLPSSPAPPVPPKNVRDTPSRPSFFSTGAASPRRSAFPPIGAPASSPSDLLAIQSNNPSAAECVQNIRTLLAFFTAKVEKITKSMSEAETLESAQVMDVIEANLGRLDLVDSPAMADLRRYSEAGEHEAFFRKFSGVACRDVLGLIPKE